MSAGVQGMVQPVLREATELTELMVLLVQQVLV